MTGFGLNDKSYPASAKTEKKENTPVLKPAVGQVTVNLSNVSPEVKTSILKETNTPDTKDNLKIENEQGTEIVDRLFPFLDEAMGKADYDLLDKLGITPPKKIIIPNPRYEKENSLHLQEKDYSKGITHLHFGFNADVEKSTFEAPMAADPDYGEKCDFYYVNGINTPLEKGKASAEIFSKFTHQKVKLIHNETHGIPLDAAEVVLERVEGKFDEVTDKTARYFAATLKSNKHLKIIAHSQGAAITANALRLCEIGLVNEKITEIRAEIAQSKGKLTLSDDQVRMLAQVKVNKIMADVEVITLGGAAAQDSFPNVKLVQGKNPGDHVPDIMGFATPAAIAARKTVSYCDGKITVDTGRDPYKDAKSPSHGSRREVFHLGHSEYLRDEGKYYFKTGLKTISDIGATDNSNAFNSIPAITKGLGYTGGTFGTIFSTASALIPDNFQVGAASVGWSMATDHRINTSVMSYFDHDYDPYDEAYLCQADVQSLLYNFGRQPFVIAGN
jgi:hypothetical protein